MAELIERRPADAVRTDVAVSAPWRQAFRILHLGFIAAPTLAGVDKFFHVLVNWDQYLAAPIARMLPVSGHAFMQIVGVIEIVAGLLVAVKPKIGGVVVAAWLAGIILNLLIAGNYFDVALRDFGLMLGALALSRLASQHEHVSPRRVSARAR